MKKERECNTSPSCGGESCKKQEKNPRLGAVGGSAVLEGVMMKGKTHYAVAVRDEQGAYHVCRDAYTSVRKKHRLLNLPLIRGVVAFAESMALSVKTLNFSARVYGTDTESPEESISKKTMNILFLVASVLAVALALFLFQWMPAHLTGLLGGLFDRAGVSLPRLGKNLIEGAIKLLILLTYLGAVSLLKDIRRTFAYHGAEHKAIFCYEAGEELTVENVKKYRRFHPRCGTSFLFVMILIGVLISCLPFVPWENLFLRVGFKLLLLPLVMGLGFEFLMLTGKHQNALTRLLSAPGMWVQRITTREPNEEQIVAAILSLKGALPDEFGYDFPTECILCTTEGDPIAPASTEDTEAPTSVTEEATDPS